MNTSVHRLLDDAFVGLTMTPDVQDLKEEIRANLLDRVAELTADGMTPDDAARRAFDELGDVRALVEEASGPTAEGCAREPLTPGPALSSAAAGAAQWRRAPVQRRYVAGIVVASVVILLALAPLIWAGMLLADNSPGEWYLSLALGAPLLIGPAVGWIVAASLTRDTATNYGMPRKRAAAYGIAWALVVTGLIAGVGTALLFASPNWLIQMAPLVVAGGAWLAYLVATQTNRKKQWALAEGLVGAEAADRFSRDPAAAARFGIYTVVLWSLTGAAVLIVGQFVGWGWVWLPGVLGWALFMLMLATMLFGSKHTEDDRTS